MSRTARLLLPTVGQFAGVEKAIRGRRIPALGLVRCIAKRLEEILRLRIRLLAMPLSADTRKRSVDVLDAQEGVYRSMLTVIVRDRGVCR
jgi:hypothetical protein